MVHLESETKDVDVLVVGLDVLAVCLPYDVSLQLLSLGLVALPVLRLPQIPLLTELEPRGSKSQRHKRQNCQYYDLHPDYHSWTTLPMKDRKIREHQCCEKAHSGFYTHSYWPAHMTTFELLLCRVVYWEGVVVCISDQLPRVNSLVTGYCCRHWLRRLYCFESCTHTERATRLWFVNTRSTHGAFHCGRLFVNGFSMKCSVRGQRLGLDHLDTRCFGGDVVDLFALPCLSTSLPSCWDM